MLGAPAAAGDVRVGGTAIADVAVVDDASGRRGCAEDWLRPLPLLSLPPAPDGHSALQDFLPGSLDACAVPLLTWSELVFYARAGVAGVAPTRVEDLFDQRRFPGPRALRRSPVGLLELALLADAVPASAVYATLATDAGLDRALARLRPLLDQVLWFERGRAVIDALAGGRAVLGLASSLDWNAAGAANSPLAPLWDGELTHTDVLVLPRSGTRPDLAWRLVARLTAGDTQALLAQLGGYGPVRHSALDGLSLDLQQRLPARARCSRSRAWSRRRVRPGLCHNGARFPPLRTDPSCRQHSVACRCRSCSHSRCSRRPAPASGP